MSTTSAWTRVCRLEELTPARGACAVVAGRQVALVRTVADEVYAVSNRDPFSGAFVLSRGIVGSRTVAGESAPTLQSPLYKQAFDLRTGACLDAAGQRVPSYDVRVRDGVVEVSDVPREESPP